MAYKEKYMYFIKKIFKIFILFISFNASAMENQSMPLIQFKTSNGIINVPNEISALIVRPPETANLITIPITNQQAHKLIKFLQNVNQFLLQEIPYKNNQLYSFANESSYKLRDACLFTEGKIIASLFYDKTMCPLSGTSAIKQTIMSLGFNFLLSIIESYDGCIFVYKIIEATEPFCLLKDLNRTLNSLLGLEKGISDQLHDACKNYIPSTINFDYLTTHNDTLTNNKLWHMVAIGKELKLLKKVKNISTALDVAYKIESSFLKNCVTIILSEEVESIVTDEYDPNFILVSFKKNNLLELIHIPTKIHYSVCMLPSISKIDKLIKSGESNIIALFIDQNLHLYQINKQELLLLGIISFANDFKGFSWSKLEHNRFAIAFTTHIEVYDVHDLKKKACYPVGYFSENWQPTLEIKFISWNPTNRLSICIGFLMNQRTFISMYNIGTKEQNRIEISGWNELPKSMGWHPIITNLLFVTTVEKKTEDKKLHIYIVQSCLNTPLTDLSFPLLSANLAGKDIECEWIKNEKKHSIIISSNQHKKTETVIEFPSIDALISKLEFLSLKENIQNHFVKGKMRIKNIASTELAILEPFNNLTPT